MRLLVVLGVFACACNSAPAQRAPADPAVGNLQLAIGNDVRELPFSKVSCVDEGDVRRVELLFNRDVPGGEGRPYRPRVLVARTHGDRVVEAHVFAAQISVADVEYKELMVSATGPKCRLEQGEETMIACNDADIVPWLAAGARPRPSFKAVFSCPP